MSIFFGLGGVNKQVVDFFFGLGGVNKRVLQGFIGLGGVNHQFYQYFTGSVITITTPGSGTVTIPNGAHGMQITIEAAGGSGELKGSGNYGSGGGGGAGMSAINTALTSADWGTTINYTVGGNHADADGDNSAVSATNIPSAGAPLAATCQGGQYGASGGAGGVYNGVGAGAAYVGFNGSNGGTGGGAGGNGGGRSAFGTVPSCTGGVGEGGLDSPPAGNGGLYGGGGGGGKHDRGLGANGRVVFTFTP